MNKTLVICFYMFGICSTMRAQESIELTQKNLNWQQSYSSAKKLSKSMKKPILIFFTGSDWCSPCKMLVKDFFESERLKEIDIKEFILYEADTPRNRNLVTKSQKSVNNKLKNKFDINFFPTVIIINENEKSLGKMRGYNSANNTNYHYSFIEAVLKKYRKTL